MAIAFSNLSPPDINDSTNAASYATASWTPPTSGLILVIVENTKATGSAAPTMSGNSLTWVQIATIQTDPGNAHRLTLFGANASGSTTGATTVDFGGQSQIGCEASFFLATGVDLSGGVAAAFVQSPTNSGTGTASSVTLVAAGAADNRPISGHTHQANEVTAPRTNWVEADDLAHGAPVVGTESQWREDAFETTASASWTTSAAWLGIAAELKAEVVVEGQPAAVRTWGIPTGPGFRDRAGKWN